MVRPHPGPLAVLLQTPHPSSQAGSCVTDGLASVYPLPKQGRADGHAMLSMDTLGSEPADGEISVSATLPFQINKSLKVIIKNEVKQKHHTPDAPGPHRAASTPCRTPGRHTAHSPLPTFPPSLPRLRSSGRHVTEGHILPASFAASSCHGAPPQAASGMEAKSG